MDISLQSHKVLCSSVRLGGWCLRCWGACIRDSMRPSGWCFRCWGACICSSVGLGGWCFGCWGVYIGASVKLGEQCFRCWGDCTCSSMRLGRWCLQCWGACEWKKVKTAPQCKFNVCFNLRWQLTFIASIWNPCKFMWVLPCHNTKPMWKFPFSNMQTNFKYVEVLLMTITDNERKHICLYWKLLASSKLVINEYTDKAFYYMLQLKLLIM